MSSSHDSQKNDGFEKERGQWLDQIAADAELPAAGLRAAIMIAHYVNRDERVAWPSMDRIAQDYGLHRQTVLAGLKALVDRGHLDVTLGRGRRPSVYQWRLSGVVIRSEPARWNRRSGPEPSTTTEDRSGMRNQTTTGAESTSDDGRSGIRNRPVVVDGFGRSGRESTTLTSYEPSIEPPKPQAVPSGRPGAPRRARHAPLDSGGRSHAPLESVIRPRAGPRPARPDDATSEHLDEAFAAIWESWVFKDRERNARDAFRLAVASTSLETVTDHLAKGGGDSLVQSLEPLCDHSEAVPPKRRTAS